MSGDQDDFVVFKDDQAALTTTENTPSSTLELPWRILVVDDDVDVHSATEFALAGLKILDRPLEFIHAYSAAEAIDLLMVEANVAVALLDVVMETEEAGLSAITTIRNDLGLREIQIILRTGQPGYAPEVETIRRYDINDYRTKSELSRVKLYTALTTSIRSYDQLRSLSRGKAAIELAMRTGSEMLAESDAATGLRRLLERAVELVSTGQGALLCLSKNIGHVELGIGPCEAYSGCSATQLPAEMADTLVRRLEQSLREKRTLIDPDAYTLYFPTAEGRALQVYIPRSVRHEGPQRQLLDMFCSNVAVCIDNQNLVGRLTDVAYRDALTGLPNRPAFVDEVNRRLQTAARTECALYLLDIDQFAEINDMFGHRSGDELLREIGHRLRAGLPAGLMVARLAADTFAVLGQPEALSDDVIRKIFSAPFDLEGEQRFISVTSAYVPAAETESDSDGTDLLKDASIVIKRAKEQGQGRHGIYTQEHREETRRHTRILHELGMAFRQKKLHLVFQPQVALANRRVLGVEALLRWRKEDGSYVPPDQFIPIAESSGLIGPLGDWVLSKALEALQEIHRAGHAQLRMAVNVSAKQLNAEGFLGHLDNVLQESGIPPALLELEVTESASTLGFDELHQALLAFRSRGVEVAIDDFGTGYSSLSYLDRLPATRLKIDRSFVNALSPDHSGSRITELVVPLGRQLGMHVLAEGVETEAQAGHLLQLGCEEAQGYLFARPMPLVDLLVWLNQQANPATC